MSIRKKIWKITKRTFQVFGILLLCFICYFIWDIRMPTPPIDDSLSVEQYKRIEVAPNHYTVGNNWLKKNDKGIWEMYIEGEPYERGLIYGVLAKELMEKQEVHFVNQINDIVPNRFFLFFLKMFVAWFNGDLDEYIPSENQTEIYGVSQSFSDKYNYVGPKYYRILNYHAAHDIGHALKDLNMVGCSSFSANNTLTKDSSMLIARNFDFYMGDEFAEDKLLLFVKPSKGYAFSSYSWAGLTGVVSGMNEQGLTVTLNASKSDIPTGAKDPISILAREILQYAKNIEEAVAIAKKRSTFVSESLLIGSANDNRTVIIEKSPTKVDVLDTQEDLVLCANHYQSDLFLKDSVNILNIANSDSKHRLDRMGELLDNNDLLTVNDAITILRNKEGVNNEFVGYGNPKSLNQLIAHHGIIFKPLEKKVWVSTPPYQLGDFICYDLDDAFASTNNINYIDSLTVKKDPFVNTIDFKNYQAFKKVKQIIQKSILLGSGLTLTKKQEKQFIQTNPKSYITYMVLGDYHKNQENYTQAIDYYNQSLTYSLASVDEENIIKNSILDCKLKLKDE